MLKRPHMSVSHSGEIALTDDGLNHSSHFSFSPAVEVVGLTAVNAYVHQTKSIDCKECTYAYAGGSAGGAGSKLA
jgi:hypothetical protein